MTTSHAAGGDVTTRCLIADDHRFALVETLAHLEYLRAQGQAARELRAAVWWYVPQR